MISSYDIDLKCNYCHINESCERGYCDFCGTCEGDFIEFAKLDFFLCVACFSDLQIALATGISKTLQDKIPEVKTQEIIIVNRKSITEEERDFIFSRDGYQCVQCGSNKRLQIDHVHPFSEGGKTSSDNLQTLCKSCNCKKGSRVYY